MEAVYGCHCISIGKNGRKTEQESQDYFQIARQVLMERGLNHVLKHGMKHEMGEEGMRTTRSEGAVHRDERKVSFLFSSQREMGRGLKSCMNKKNSDSLSNRSLLCHHLLSTT